MGKLSDFRAPGQILDIFDRSKSVDIIEGWAQFLNLLLIYKLDSCIYLSLRRVY